MTHTFNDLVIGGVLMAPVLTYALATLVLVFVLRAVLHRIGFSSVFTSSPLAELSLYVSLFGLLILLF
jgi:hypothetical protein